ncbi:hypothetical protein PAPYR_1099 [Paratrimastix pyriformis]|uniref:Uncharacterized protein n=1 Tax=Paratrimastix pyriformis TaxID=342808 RepID=A0ABQ8UV82_9EUKA|nr:hypothetical protein PAPYR_1099 [Paratrimastix pyriformis]
MKDRGLRSIFLQFNFSTLAQDALQNKHKHSHILLRPIFNMALAVLVDMAMIPGVFLWGDPDPLLNAIGLYGFNLFALALFSVIPHFLQCIVMLADHIRLMKKSKQTHRPRLARLVSDRLLGRIRFRHFMEPFGLTLLLLGSDIGGWLGCYWWGSDDETVMWGGVGVYFGTALLFAAIPHVVQLVQMARTCGGTPGRPPRVLRAESPGPSAPLPLAAGLAHPPQPPVRRGVPARSSLTKPLQPLQPGPAALLPGREGLQEYAARRHGSLFAGEGPRIALRFLAAARASASAARGGSSSVPAQNPRLPPPAPAGPRHTEAAPLEPEGDNERAPLLGPPGPGTSINEEHPAPRRAARGPPMERLMRWLLDPWTGLCMDLLNDTLGNACWAATCLEDPWPAVGMWGWVGFSALVNLLPHGLLLWGLLWDAHCRHRWVRTRPPSAPNAPPPATLESP